MSALVYLVSRKLKNRVKEIFHRPTELIVLLVVLALAVFVIWTGNLSRESESLRDFGELEAILLGIYSVVFILIAKNGFVNGAAMFSMSDVNLLFDAPFRPKTMLSYGLFSQMGHALSLGIVLVYQYSWLRSAYGISLIKLLAIVIGYAMTVFLAQMLAMLIYSLTSGSDRKCRIAKVIFYGVWVVFLALFAEKVLSSPGELLPRVVAAANSPLMHLLPVVGFLRFGVAGALTQRWNAVLIALCCFAVCVVVYYVLVSLLRIDFYEDVLKAAEVSFSAITARKEGKAQELAPRNVKVGKTGLSRGEGAAVIGVKHAIENRRSRFLLFDLMSVIFAAATVVFALIIKDVIGAFAFSIYMMVLSVGSGRWAKELTLPYVYLIPEPPFKKLFYTIKEQLPSLAAQSVLNFVLLPFLIDCDWLTCIAMMTARFSFGLLFIGVNLLLSRLLGGNGNNKAIIVMVYFLFCLLASIPAIAAGVALYYVYLGFASITFSFFAIFAVNLLLAMLLIFLCRNILETSQNNNR
ncbi:MAG: putative ABC exporter domain-containing protein [Clostridia bacterium]|nr:putative ABC exporter domain-containing protein [Clostridia bacterium]